MDVPTRFEFEYMKIQDQRTALNQYILSYFNGGILYSSALLVAFIGFGKASGVVGAGHPFLFVVGGVISVAVLFMTLLLISAYERSMVSLYPRIVTLELILNYYFFRQYLQGEGEVYRTFVEDCDKFPRVDPEKLWESVRERSESLPYNWNRTTVQLRTFVICVLLVIYVTVASLMVWVS